MQRHTESRISMDAVIQASIWANTCVTCVISVLPSDTAFSGLRKVASQRMQDAQITASHRGYAKLNSRCETVARVSCRPSKRIESGSIDNTEGQAKVKRGSLKRPLRRSSRQKFNHISDPSHLMTKIPISSLPKQPRLIAALVQQPAPASKVYSAGS